MDRPAWKRFATLVAKTAVAGLVLVAVSRHVFKTWEEIQKRGESFRVEPTWLIAAGFLYLAGLTAAGLFFAAVMNTGKAPVSTAASVRAYLVSHLAKYVPGKAMVVVVRVGLVVPYGARPATAAIATFYETLVMMAAGAAVATAGFAVGAGPSQQLPLALAGGLTVAFLVMVDPWIFSRLAKRVASPFPGVGPDAHPAIGRNTLSLGLALDSSGWVLLALSQVAVIRAVSPVALTPGLVALVAASVSLATVAGFVVAVLPGGLGVREWVLMTTLTPAIGDDLSVIAALALRLTWVAAEVLAALVLLPIRPGRPGAGNVGPPGVAGATEP